MARTYKVKLDGSAQARNSVSSLTPGAPIDPRLQLKWGLALLGEEKALEYLKWLSERIEQQSR